MTIITEDSVFQARALAILDQYEGNKLYAYPDSTPQKYLTIGRGRCIDQRVGGGISEDESLYLAQNDIQKLTAELHQYSWYAKQDPIRRLALWELRFNLGATGLLHWIHFLAAMDRQDYVEAVNQIRTNAVWVGEVKDARATSIENMISTGTFA